MHTHYFFLNSAKRKVLNSRTNGSLSGLYPEKCIKGGEYFGKPFTAAQWAGTGNAQDDKSE